MPLRLVPAALLALLFAAYAPTLDAEFVVWDDDDHIYENPHVIGTEGYWHAWDWRDRLFYPLSYTAYYVDWRLSGGEPWLFHLNNVLLHAANVVLLGLLGQSIGLAPLVAWTAAGIWGLSPLQVQSVAWATERKNVLYVFFYLIALLSYTRSLRDRERERSRFWLLSLLCQLLSMLSKPAGVTVPAALALLHWTLGGRFDGRAVRRLLASVALAIPIVVMHVVREEIAPAVPLTTRVLIAARGFWTYVGRFLWPVDLVPMYPSWPVTEHPLPSIVALAGLAALVAVLVWGIRRVPRSVVFAAGFFAINIAPVVGIVWFPYLWYSFTADHLAYLGSAGLALLLAVIGRALVASTRAPAWVVATTVVLLWVVLAGATRRQTALWHDTESLWRGTLAVNPESVVAHKNLGFELIQKGSLDEASLHLQEVLRLRPNDPEALLNLGLVAAERGDLDRAVSLYAATLAVTPDNSQVWTNLGIAAARRGDLDGAIAAYERAIALDPDDPVPWTDLGAARLERGDHEGAIRDHETALRLNPNFVNARFNLGFALLRAGRADEAVPHLEQASALDPTDVQTLYTLGVALGRCGRHTEAADRYRLVLALEPEHADATNNLGASLLALGDHAEAIELFERALALAPEDPDSHRILASALYRVGDVGRAVAVLEKALATLSPPPAALADRLAWIRATSANAEWRDGDTAVRLAEVAVASTTPPEVAYLDTLAAAYAEQGRFGDAVRIGRETLARSPEGSREAEDRRQRLALYEEGTPLRIPPPQRESRAPP